MDFSMKYSMTKLLATGVRVAAGLTIITLAHASETATTPSSQDPYYQIQTATVEEVVDTANPQSVSSLMPSSSSQTSQTRALNKKAATEVATVVGAAMDLSNIVDVAQLVWNIVEENKPTSNVSSDTANAVPQGVAWNDIAGWSAPQSRLYHVTFKNGFNVNVVDFTYRVVYFYGGNVGGKGHFLNGVAMVPSDISVDWGFNFSAQAKVSSITNAGTVDDPTAAMEIQMQWSVSSVIKTITQSQSYYIQGDGQFQAMN